MAIPNYTYLKMKMPSPNGVITVGSAYKHAYECDVACTEYAEALFKSEALAADLERLSKEIPDPKCHAGSFELAKEVKLIPLCPNDPDGKMLKVTLRSTPNRKSCSSTSSAQMQTYLRGVPWTCQAS
jgi:hypothetical protein